MILFSLIVKALLSLNLDLFNILRCVFVFICLYFVLRHIVILQEEQ